MNALTRLSRNIAALLALATTLALTGCLQVEQLIKVKPDGSGTIEMTARMGLEMVNQLKGLGGAQDGDPLKDLMKEEEMKAQAAKLGEGVKFERIEPIKEEKFTGKRAIFTFSDVTKLKVDIEMNSIAGDMAKPDGDEKKGEPLRFEFTKGEPAKLIILAKHENPGGGKDKAADEAEPDAQELAMMKQFMKDMRMTVAVQVEGTLAETDAAHKDGARVILADIPFSELLDDMKKFKAMSRADTFQQAYELLKDVPGVKLEPKERITVSFR